MPLTAASFLLQVAPWVSLDVRRGSVADISIPIPSVAAQSDDPQDCLLWQFQLQEYDVGFQLLENGAVVQEFGRFKATEQGDTESTINTMVVPHPLHVDALEPTMEGRFDDVTPESVYTLRWDNSYSLVRHKEVKYRFLVTSNRVVAAAELAVQESQSRSQRRARRAAAGLPLAHLAKTLEKERAMNDEERKVENERVAANLEQTVMDIVSIFIAKPDSPLHEGAIRPFILALEAVLCHGIKEEFLDVWPEAPFYEFLIETQHVLRDDMGIVARVQAGEPPSNLQHLGWNKSRSFLLLALNKGVLQRAFENLTKRRTVVEKYYESRALLYKYDDARRIASFLSALNGVTFLLAAYPHDECDKDDQPPFPRNLKQCAPEAPLLGNEISFQNDVDGDSSVVRFMEENPDEIKQLQNCSVPRYILHGEPFQDIGIGRSSVELLSIDDVEGAPVVLAQVQVQTQDILLSVATRDGQDLTKPTRFSASDEWIELVMRFKSSPAGGLALKLDNAYSMVRSKQVQVRYVSVDAAAYVAAWEGCLEMARSISWNHASRTGGERCAKYMASQHQKEETEVMFQRKQRGDSDQEMDDGITGFRTSLLSNPVSYIGGLLSSEDSPEACDQCLAPFSFFSRQHECPCCKKIVCIQCCRHHVQINGKGSQLKVCDRCFIQEKDKERARIANTKRKHDDDGGERPEYAALRRDPSMDKYFKMLSFGVPSSGVAQKMTQDEMPPDKIAVFVAGPDGSNASRIGRTSKKERSGSRGLNRRDSTFRKVYWTSLDTKKANETIWARVTARRKTAPITLSPQDFQELEFLFGNPTAASSSQSKEKTAKKIKFSALDSRRSNNISIGLSQFKAVGGAEAILSALQRCDFEFLTVDRLTNLQDIAPNSVEVKRYTNFKGSRSRLEPAEKFLVEICEISRVTEKIKALLFASQFKHQQQKLRNRIRVITQACYEVLRSERLARCFELVLAIGNLLNTGTELEGAQGITLASLLKLSETKAIDQSMTLLQFSIKLIHDRGEGDVLLFTNDLSTLAEARRYSNVICDSQARALQHEIIKLGQEIKEDMVEDLKRFNGAEALRKRQFEHRKAQQHRPAMIQSNRELNNLRDGSSGAQNTVLDATRQRGAIDSGTRVRKNGVTASNQHAAMLAAIRTRGNGGDTISTKLDRGDTLSPASASHAALLNAIRKRPQKLQNASDLNGDDLTRVGGAHEATSAEQTKHNRSDAAGTRSALLASIKQRHSDSAADQNGAFTLDPQAALLVAIWQQAKKPMDSMPTGNGVGGSSKEDEEFEPRQYKMDSKFISIMRERLMSIKAAFEDIEMDLEALHSVWEGTARYLAEDSCASSTEYVFGLLNRFLLDVKVAKTLLFRKGLNFASEANALLPRAYVGSIVATKFGSGIITALRVSDKRIEVKFPWSREAYLEPSSILSVGSLVRCRQWGVGIIRETCYDVGFCDVRFSFGYGKVRVEELVLETSSNKEELRIQLLRCGFCIGDPIVTPFGCGHVQSIRGKPQSPTAVLAVGMLSLGSDVHDKESSLKVVAYVPARHVKRNY
ncbi:Formin Homology 2 Domain [Phytophthora infestans]|uniref:Formin Homology 2 Domain n=1 Tax=Phytophthora infestans TaxID=4787 RepID=A0A8S9TJF1_PHYIN|nr:Formin Homology 2 Domain [Phytophthora infestans]